MEEQGLVNLMKSKFKALHLGQVSPRYQYRLSDAWVWSSPVEKDLDVPVHIKSDMPPQYALAAQKADHILVYINIHVTSMSEQVILPVHSTLVRPHLEQEYCIQP